MLAGTALAAAIVVSMSAGARAEPPAVAQIAMKRDSGTDISAQRRPRRVPIYPNRYGGHWEPDVVPRYNPGPNAVRVCDATYVQEHRVSGTVIVPHMSCYWRRG
ncbi:conserved exported hypothetical protein [Bradyrhizobium sp. STM 3809]|nr:conserved exported hypothetical protein [Bradyrhizobium sp. STM 3809]